MAVDPSVALLAVLVPCWVLWTALLFREFRAGGAFAGMLAVSALLAILMVGLAPFFLLFAIKILVDGIRERAADRMARLVFLLLMILQTAAFAGAICWHEALAAGPQSGEPAPEPDGPESGR